ncbi:unnamed protein product [Rhodiola kirilowii]
MGRGKLPMEYIATEKARKSSFKKRREGLVKKIRELAILCGIDACLIIYGPRNNDGVKMEVHTWPKERTEVERILQKYELKRNESSSKHLNLMDFFGNQTCKINEQIVKTRREIAKAKFAKSAEFGVEGMSGAELKDALVAVDKKIEMVSSRIEAEKEKVKLSRGMGIAKMLKHDDVQIVDSSNRLGVMSYLGSQVTENFKPLQDQSYLGAQVTENFKPLYEQSYLGAQVNENFRPLHCQSYLGTQVLCAADYNAYVPLPNLSDTFLTQSNYSTDILADYVPLMNGDGQSEYRFVASNVGQFQFQTQNCEQPQYLETGSYYAAQQQQQSMFTSALPGNCFQSGNCDSCYESGECYGNFCAWQRNNNRFE